MTVCLVAQSTFKQIPAFVLCADRRLSDGTFRHDKAAKFFFLGYNCFAMVSGHWNMAKEMGLWLKRGLMGYPSPPAREDLKDRIEAVLGRFALTSLCDDDTSAEAIITAFPDEQPIAFLASICARQVTVKLASECQGIGEGYEAAEKMLKYRGYDPLNTPLTMTCYLLYEAKRFSEVYLSVSQDSTLIKIHTPIGSIPERDDYALYEFGPDKMNLLENHKSKVFPNTADTIDEIRWHFFTKADAAVIKKLEAPPSPQPINLDLSALDQEIEQMGRILEFELPVERLDLARQLVSPLVDLIDSGSVFLKVDSLTASGTGGKGVVVKLSLSDRYIKLVAALRALYRECGVAL